jgi:thioredoxin reductase (NADPH)
MIDCLIIGGGPAGLTAAIYLARFRLQCAVIDGGESRAALIPTTHNFPSYPEGIAGVELLARLRTQLRTYGIEPTRDSVTRIEPEATAMRVVTASGEVKAKTILLATGKKDTRPVFEDGKHDEAVRSGLLHYCPICDAYEVRHKPIIVFGSGEHGIKEAIFLRRYTREIELICPDGGHCLNASDEKRAREAGIKLIDGPVSALRMDTGGLAFRVGSKDRLGEDVYVAMGCRQRSELARFAGAELSDDGCIVVDEHQRTTVPRLYAAGDVIVGLDQITTAVGHAAIAATAIRNDLLD